MARLRVDPSAESERTSTSSECGVSTERQANTRDKDVELRLLLIK